MLYTGLLPARSTETLTDKSVGTGLTMMLCGLICGVAKALERANVRVLNAMVLRVMMLLFC